MGSNTHFFLAYMEVVEKVTGIVSNILAGKEIELVDLIYKREGPNMVLRLILDKKGGITLDECAWVNEQLSEVLENDEDMQDRYLLEVSSPGLDRNIRTKKDFDRVINEQVRVITYGPVEGRKEHLGRVVSCDQENLTIALKDTDAQNRIPLKMISSARLDIKFK